MTLAMSEPATRFAPLDPGYFRRNVTESARGLIGVRLTVEGVGGLIVETEAYDATDTASHSFRGPTVANAAMFGPQGHPSMSTRAAGCTGVSTSCAARSPHAQ